MMVLTAHLVGLLNFTHFVSTAGYGAIFVLCLLQSCCVPTSSELTMGLAGALAAQGRLSIAAVILVGALGEVVGAYIAWMVGRLAGRAAVDRFGRYILVSHRDLDRAEAWYDRHGRFGVFGSRLLPVIRNFVALPAGIAEVPAVRFGVLTAFGSLLWDGAWAGIGYGVGGHWHAIAKGVGDLGYVLAVVAAGFIVFAAHHRYRSYKQGASEHDEDRPPPSGRAIGAVRWVGGSSGRPPEEFHPAHEQPSAPLSRSDPPMRAASAGRGPVAQPSRGTGSGTRPAANRWVGGSSVRPQPPEAHGEFPHSPIAAWGAAVARGGSAREPAPADLVSEGASVEANGRLTAMLGALLLVLLAVEGATLLHLSTLLTLHVVVGMVLVPVIVLKIGSATWRFAKYYLGSPDYRRKGPPPAALRLLGPFVVVLSVAVLATGIALLLVPTGLRNEMLFLHKATFILWFAAMVVHVLGHLLDVARFAPRDFYWRTRRQVRGASTRQWAIVGAVCVGVLLALAVAPKIGPWLAARNHPGHKIVPVHDAASNPG